ncbi:MAG TPA: hypothetical protein VEH27_06260 [Methylomirabilota bacterium]|nr:hypothetical protein [Methylomirabilota bacterium]
MSEDDDSQSQRLLNEYAVVFQNMDDHTLARWMAQTLGQLEGSLLRASHPLVAAYRLASHVAHERQVWLKRLATPPAAYGESECCRAPLVPLFTRDIIEVGLVCQHCFETAVPFADLPPELKDLTAKWAEEYGTIHAVAHWDDKRRLECEDYDEELEMAASQAESSLVFLAMHILPKFLNHYPILIWEDQDGCLEVLPEDIVLKAPPLS